MASPVELRESLRHDKAVLGIGVLLVLAVIPLSTPLLTVEWRAAYGHYIVGLPFLGALIVGFARAISIHLFAELELVAIYLIMVLVLAFRPEGLFGQVEERRI